ncbi:MAG TPA: cytochrome b/b6 domain-containing protein [Usitatibacter sp.]|nr:cytochrome b/b6 domain-containing protein [Usitatibacter sp.]
MTEAAAPIRVWDLPTRIFHWALAALVAFSFATGQVGGDWMPWHLRSGYAVLTLLLFRIAWGFAGSRTARFAHFLRGWRAVARYARATIAGRPPPFAGHNPLGGWVVVAMLAALAFQAATGLFSSDEIATQGPLANKVSDAIVSRMSSLHSLDKWVLVALVAAHVAAIATYRLAWNVRLVGPMIHGRMRAPPGVEEPPRRPAWLALAALCACAAAVWYLVEIYPMR